MLQPMTLVNEEEYAEDKPANQQERVYTRGREAILNGHFVPGRSVTLRGVAASLDVSPMPVREALSREGPCQCLFPRRCCGYNGDFDDSGTATPCPPNYAN